MTMPISIRWRVAAAVLAAAGLAACNGNSAVPASPGAVQNAPIVDQQPAPGAPAVASVPAAPAQQTNPNALGPVVISPGAVNGADNMFSPRDGDMKDGGQGQNVDGVSCDRTMVTNLYHVHVYLGIVDNGRLVAMPDAVGMVDPGPDANGYTNTAQCFYHIHTHDASGMIHLEVDRNLPYSDVIFKLKNLLDIWGVPHDSTRFGPFQGPVHVFVGNVPLKQTVVSHYAPYNGNYEDIRLRSHEAIWIEIGSKYYTQTQLPSVTFYTEY